MKSTKHSSSQLCVKWGIVAAMASLLILSTGCISPEQLAMEREWRDKPYDPNWRPPNDSVPGYKGGSTGGFGGVGPVSVGKINIPTSGFKMR